MKSLKQLIYEAQNSDGCGTFNMSFKDFCLQVAAYFDNYDEQEESIINMCKILDDVCHKLKPIYLENGAVRDKELSKMYKDKERWPVKVKKLLTGSNRKGEKYRYFVSFEDKTDNNFSFESDENIQFTE